MLFYRIFMALALPFVLLVLLLKRSGHLGERLGFGPPAASGPKLWLHGASNGELTSARWVLEAVLKAAPDLHVLVTCNTRTARQMVLGWDLPQVTTALAPLDTVGAVARVLRRWQPCGLLIVENELWPTRIAKAHARGIPVLVIGARMSDRSARRWQRMGGLMAQTLARVRWLSAQDEASLQRLTVLGLAGQAIGPVIALKAVSTATLRRPPFTAIAPRNRIVLAASTHEGDDALILDAFIAAHQANRLDHLIIAPRHPRRSDQIAALVASRGLRFATRSKAEVPGVDTLVYLADTMGEMDYWYAMAGLTIIGGSFTDKGGHTPWEPAAHGSAILHGPDVANFAAPFAALDAAGGAVLVRDGAQLAQVLIELDEIRQSGVAFAACGALQPPNSPDVLVDKILAVLSAANASPTSQVSP